jgi:hypothetical protein
MLTIAAVIAIGLCLVIAAVVLYASTKPDTFVVQRSARIEASADRIFPLINDFKSWAVWSPFEKLDPAMKRTYSATTSGTGASYAWAGNAKAGEGRMDIVEALAPERVSLALTFTRPFRANHAVEFTLRPVGGGANVPTPAATEVTWSMRGSAPLVSKIFGIFVDMDKMIGRDFETGLQNLKTASESSSFAMNSPDR